LPSATAILTVQDGENAKSSPATTVPGACERNEQDWQRHVDYIHFNPDKHGGANSPAEREFSSFTHAVRNGGYEPNWGKQEPPSIRDLCLA
jgi:hypothetical protein